MGKYEPLTRFLKSQKLEKVQVTFKEIERVLGEELPASALKHRPWWANTGGSHVQSEAWLEAGFETESVDMDARRLVFRRVERPSGSLAAGASAVLRGASLSFDNVYGCLSGTVRIHGDITQPSGETWSAESAT